MTVFLNVFVHLHQQWGTKEPNLRLQQTVTMAAPNIYAHTHHGRVIQTNFLYHEIGGQIKLMPSVHY